MQKQQNDDSNLSSITPLQTEEEIARIMGNFEKLGWSKELQEKMARGEMVNPQYLAYKKHIHDMASMAGDTVHNMEMAVGGNLIDNQNNAEQV